MEIKNNELWSSKVKKMTKDNSMNYFGSFFFFGIPGLLMFLGVYFLNPALTVHGVPLIVSWPTLVLGPIAILFIIVLVLFMRKSNRPSFKERFRFNKLTKKEWLIILGAFIVVQLLELALSPTGAYFSQFSFFSPPEGIPDLFNPTFNIENGLPQLLGVPVKGSGGLYCFG